MYWKLVEETEFDANDQLYKTESMVACIMAPIKSAAKLWFDLLIDHNIIKASKSAHVENATVEEYEYFIEKLN